MRLSSLVYPFKRKRNNFWYTIFYFLKEFFFPYFQSETKIIRKKKVEKHNFWIKTVVIFFFSLKIIEVTVVMLAQGLPSRLTIALENSL